MVGRLHAQNKCRSKQTATDSRGDDQGRGDGQSKINTAPSVTYGPGRAGPQEDVYMSADTFLCGTLINITLTQNKLFAAGSDQRIVTNKYKIRAKKRAGNRKFPHLSSTEEHRRTTD